jgi:hypothetical protein
MIIVMMLVYGRDRSVEGRDFTRARP